MKLLEEFIFEISKKSEFQKNYLGKWEITEAEREELNHTLHFLVDELHKDMKDIVDAYLFINDMFMEERYYFYRHGKYRNSTFEEANKMVYANPQYMEKYMIGLSISDYIWINHIKMLRYFEESSGILSCPGGCYLEIGPGLGQYLVRAITHMKFKEYHACDISKTSVEKSNRYLKYRKLAERCEVQEKDFFLYTPEELFDCVVMGEVLEHVEDPFSMLKKIYEIMNKNGKAFITTVINAPAVDHIYLFSSIEEVLDIAERAGFRVKDYLCTTEGHISLEKAMQRKGGVNIAMILER